MDENNHNLNDGNDANKIFSDDTDSKVVKQNDLQSVGSYP